MKNIGARLEFNSKVIAQNHCTVVTPGENLWAYHKGKPLIVHWDKAKELGIEDAKIRVAPLPEVDVKVSL